MTTFVQKNPVKQWFNFLKTDTIRKFAPNNVHVIVDIGCGWCAATKKMTEWFKHADYWGLDNSEYMVTKSRETMPDLAQRNRFVLADMANPEEWPKDFQDRMQSKQVDLISAQVSVGHGCTSKESFDKLFNVCASALNTFSQNKGVFIMTILDEEKVREALLRYLREKGIEKELLGEKIEVGSLEFTIQMQSKGVAAFLQQKTGIDCSLHTVDFGQQVEYALPTAWFYEACRRTSTQIVCDLNMADYVRHFRLSPQNKEITQKELDIVNWYRVIVVSPQ